MPASLRPARTACQPAMQADRQHLRCAFLTLSIKHVEAVHQVTLELLAVGEASLDRKPHVVAIHGVGNAQLVLTTRLDPVG